MTAQQWLPQWMRSVARWALADELARMRAALAIANADARDALAAHDLARVELAGFQRYAARRDAPRCVQVPLWSDRHVAEWTDRVHRFSGDETLLESYPCTLCAPHPILGRPRHVRPSDTSVRPPTVLAGPVTRERIRRIRGRLAALPHGLPTTTETGGDPDAGDR